MKMSKDTLGPVAGMCIETSRELPVVAADSQVDRVKCRLWLALRRIT